jgi:hypothetical protein
MTHWKEQTVKYRARFVGKALMLVAAIAVLGGIVMALWNAVVPSVFSGTGSVDYPHALGLLILSRILFGGFRGRGGWHEGRGWRRWEGMTPEEREQFKQRAQSRCGRATEKEA